MKSKATLSTSLQLGTPALSQTQIVLMNNTWLYKWFFANRLCEEKYILFFQQFDCFVSSERLQPIFKQFVYLIKHAKQMYSQWNINNHILSKTKYKILMSS